ncbi:MAG: hypothetical protein J6J74_04735 [Elusimicrobiaceae bacterium]|nr:hypothetical protein [Elusimicrobiaceae bacterium]
MNESSAWKPTLLWHAKVFGVLLACCTAAYFVLAYATAKLPAPYQKRQPAPEATPWLNR